jgi:N-acetylated-alpha-linked acidic dipeptidase
LRQIVYFTSVQEESMRIKKLRKLSGVFASLLITTAWLAPVSRGQSDGGGTARSIRGFSDTQAGSEFAWEEKMRAIPDPALLREYMKHLTARPHHVGSPYDKENAEFILAKFKSWGLDAHIEEFDVLFPTPKDRLVEMVEPTRYKAKLQEPVIAEDPNSGDPGQLPVYNAYSADGDVTGQLVYVNYGVPADYEELAKLCVDVKGKIVIARYGGSWRGIKPKVAYEHGAIGCLIYSDPRDDGYYQGDVYPKGPFRPEQGAQRGSVMDMPIHPGDPLTPGWGAVKGAKRIPREEAEVLLKIPVLPISYGDALPLLRALQGPVALEPWRGALPITYHIGPGPARVHLRAMFDWSLHTIYDVIGRIEGSTYPDEWIIQGNHHDAWVEGAEDPISGQVTLMEEARALGELTRQGWRPKRTMIFCAWDGEEEGLLGSTEWVETHASELSEKAVVYLNSDSTGKGWLEASGSHTLERFINEAARDIHQPKSDKSVWEALKGHDAATGNRRSLPGTPGDLTEEQKKEAERRPDLHIGALGSGSDYTPFIQHLGIASLNTGFGGESAGGIYHSIYDTFTWYTRFGDPTFEFGRGLSQLNGTIMMRLAGAQVLPFEFTDLADTVKTYVNEIEKLGKAAGSPAAIDLAPLESAVKAVDESAHRYDHAFRRASESGGASLEGLKREKALNELLYKSERRLTNEQGLPRRPWFKHMLYAPGFYTGYGVKTIPGVREAIEQKSWAELEPQIRNASGALRALASQIDEATRILEGR